MEALLRTSPLQGNSFLPEIAHLHPGERDAIRLALALDLELLVEEEEGRQAAEQLGIPYSGIAAQLLIAVQEGVLPKAKGRRQLRILLDRGRINQRVFNTVRPQL